MISPKPDAPAPDEGNPVLLDCHGRFKARLEGPVSGNLLLRQAQHHRVHQRAEFCCSPWLSPAVAGKLKNCRQVLLRGARETGREDDNAVLSAAADELGRALARLEHAPDLDAVRGIEGDAAKRYFAVLRPDRASRRARGLHHEWTHPWNHRLDRMNAVLSFLYAMLMNDVPLGN